MTFQVVMIELVGGGDLVNVEFRGTDTYEQHLSREIPSRVRIAMPATEAPKIGQRYAWKLEAVTPSK